MIRSQIKKRIYKEFFGTTFMRTMDVLDFI